MIEWYSHSATLNELVTETKSELAALVAREPLTKVFLKGSVQYLELIKHRALAQGNPECATGIDLALAELKRLAEPIRKPEE